MTSAELISLGINATLALITGLYAFFTFRILRENQRVANEMALQRRDMLRPIISIGPEVDSYLVVSLVIKNTGASPATNLRLSMDRDFFMFAEEGEERNIRSFSVFNTPISTFATGSVLRFDLAQGFNLGKNKNGIPLTPMQFTITARYEFAEHKFDDEFNVDLRPFMHSTVARSKCTDEIEKGRKALEKIANKLST